MVSFPQLYERAFRASTTERERLRASLLYHLARSLGERGGFAPDALRASRLGRAASPQNDELGEALISWSLGDAVSERLGLAHRLGQTLDALLALEAGFERQERHTERKKSGSFFTPPDLARAVIAQGLSLVSNGPQAPTVCDPAVGGGAFLLEAAQALLERRLASGDSLERARREVASSLFGFDKAELACAVSEAALWILLAAEEERFIPNPRLSRCDSLAPSVPPGVPEQGFDWIVGNPPWVAYQGRAARPLAAEERRYYRERYRSFRGYPTLQALFVERAAELAPQGVIALLLPSSLSDLDGYREMRTRLTESHAPQEPLQEFGQDAFAGVVQPCFALVAAPRAIPVPGDAHAWRLSERARRKDDAARAVVPDALLELRSTESLPPELFRELGLQTNRAVTGELLLRATSPRPPFLLGLLEGRRVQEFACSEPELFMHVHLPTLERTRCLLRPSEVYRDVSFVVRQTAAFPIAAAHNGAVFRNSLLAGFASSEFDRDLLLGLLNSALYRAFHVAGQRDARQAVFPQVKLSHLRKLPRPPHDPGARNEVRRLSARASAARGLQPKERAELDTAVFRLFGLGATDQARILDYLAARSPGALSVPRPRAGARASG